MNAPRTLRLLAAAAVLSPISFVSAADIYVSPEGDDSHSGELKSPLKSLAAAQATVRALLNDETQDEPITVWLSGGTYSPAGLQLFGAEDSGREEQPVTWRAVPGQRVVISGGSTLNEQADVPAELADRIPSEARSFVSGWKLAWNDLGVDQENWQLRAGTAIQQGDRLLRPSVTPNQGWAPASWVQANQLHVPNTGLTSLKNEELTNEGQAWLHLFVDNRWQDRLVPATVTGANTFEVSSHDTSRLEQPLVRLLNSPEGLDQPGEWCYDATSQTLVAWLPQTDNPQVTVHDYLVGLYAAQDIHFIDIEFTQARHVAVELAGCQRITFQNCNVSNVGHTGVHVLGGWQNELQECRIDACGHFAVRIEAGDRNTLTSCEHRVENCVLTNFGFQDVAFSAGLYLAGVGVEVQNCEFAQGADAAIRIDGNDHIISHNDIHDVCLVTSDCGAIYLGHDWTERGNVIEHNSIANVGSHDDLDAIGIYLDDFASGAIVVGNVIRHAGRGIAVGGGRDNHIADNVIVDCQVSIQLDQRGRTWARHLVDGDSSSLRQHLALLGDAERLYFERYPALADCLTDSAADAAGNRVENNLVMGAGGIALDQGLDRSLVNFAANRRLSAPQLTTNVAWHAELATLPEVTQHIPRAQQWLLIGPQTEPQSQTLASTGN